jgi:hypothetical protein
VAAAPPPASAQHETDVALRIRSAILSKAGKLTIGAVV